MATRPDAPPARRSQHRGRFKPRMVRTTVRPRPQRCRSEPSWAEVDGLQEAFIPRSRIPKYLLEDSATPPSEMPALRRSSRQVAGATLVVGNARDLLPQQEVVGVGGCGPAGSGPGRGHTGACGERECVGERRAAAEGRPGSAAGGAG